MPVGRVSTFWGFPSSLPLSGRVAHGITGRISSRAQYFATRGVTAFLHHSRLKTLDSARIDGGLARRPQKDRIARQIGAQLNASCKSEIAWSSGGAPFESGNTIRVRSRLWVDDGQTGSNRTGLVSPGKSGYRPCGY